MQKKIYQVLYTFNVEYLSRLTFKPQNNALVKSCGAFFRIHDANVSNLNGLQHSLYMYVRLVLGAVGHFSQSRHTVTSTSFICDQT